MRLTTELPESRCTFFVVVASHTRKAFHQFAYLAALFVLCLTGLPANHAQAATRYFDVNGTTTGSGWGTATSVRTWSALTNCGKAGP